MQLDPISGRAREDLCRYLAACYYEPGPEFTEEKLFDSMRDVASRIDADLAERARRLGEAFAAEGHDRLLVDYTKLFLGPMDATARPYGSVWLEGEGLLMQDSTVAVTRLYEQGGFEIAEDFRELPDHIAAELEFLYLLLFRENQARASADDKAVAEIVELRKQFLGEHLGRWVIPFTAAVRRSAQTRFYRQLAELTERYVNKVTNANKKGEV